VDEGIEFEFGRNMLLILGRGRTFILSCSLTLCFTLFLRRKRMSRREHNDALFYDYLLKALVPYAKSGESNPSSLMNGMLYS
jgi:hypothetical protein